MLNVAVKSTDIFYEIVCREWFVAGSEWEAGGLYSLSLVLKVWLRLDHY